MKHFVFVISSLAGLLLALILNVLAASAEYAPDSYQPAAFLPSPQAITSAVYLPLIATPLDCFVREPNDSYQQAVRLAAGETQTHCIESFEDEDWFTFSITTPSHVKIEVTSGHRIQSRLYNSSQKPINSDVGEFSKIERICGSWNGPLIAGTYYVAATDWYNYEENPYSYSVKLAVTPCPQPTIQPNYTSYTTTTSLIIVGEIKNDSDSYLYSGGFTVNVFDGKNQLIATGRDNIELTYLPANQSACFYFLASGLDDWAHFSFEPYSYYTVGHFAADGKLVIYGDSGVYSEIDNRYRVLGFARNDYPSQVRSIRVAITLYDAAGTVIGCGSTYINTTTLLPGQSSSFEIVFASSWLNYARVASYKIQPQGSVVER